MLVATWVLAAATTVLALSGPVALFAWLGGKRADRAQLERVRLREQEARIGDRVDRVVADLGTKVQMAYLPKSSINFAALMAVAAVIAFLLNRREHPGSD